MNRLSELLYKENQFLQDGEIMIYVKDGEMSARYHDDESLIEINGEVNKKLTDFLEWLQDENQY